MRYFIIAGEVSGDLYARQLMLSLAEADPLAEFRYRGPDTRTAVMGFVEVAARLGAHIGELSRCKKDLLQFNPDVLILVDYPGFNLPMARFASRKGIRTLYYIAPKVWASRAWRVRIIRKYVTRLYVIFPFEVDYFASKGIKAEYLGNPVLDNLTSALETLDTPEVFRKKYKIGPEPVLAILPGSRLHEINFLLPRAAQIIRKFKDYQWIVAATPSIPTTVYDDILKDLPVRVMYGHTHEILQQAEAALITSGTATLEAALLNCPQVICYGGNSLSIAIARMIIRVKHISLPNLILEKASVRELIQKDCHPDKIEEELRLLLKGRQRRRSMLADYKRLHRILGMDGATERIARHMYTLLTGGPEVPRYKVFTSTPLGNFSFSANEFDELTACGFEDNYKLKGFFKSGAPMDPEEPKPPVLLMAIEQIDEYFKGTRRTFDLPLHIKGTDFQKNVWDNLLKINYGTTVSYAELAEMTGNPKATRAVGQANFANPFAVIIPCHRVIGADGSLVGYAAGLERKQKLLAMEKSYAPESTNSLF